MSHPEKIEITPTAALASATAHPSAWVEWQIRLLSDALEQFRVMLPVTTASPELVAHVHDLERRLEELIADTGALCIKRPPI